MGFGVFLHPNGYTSNLTDFVKEKRRLVKLTQPCPNSKEAGFPNGFRLLLLLDEVEGFRSSVADNLYEVDARALLVTGGKWLHN